MSNGGDAGSAFRSRIAIAILLLAIVLGWVIFDNFAPWRRYQREYARAQISRLEAEEREARAALERKFQRLATAPRRAIAVNQREFKEREHDIVALLKEGSPEALKRVDKLSEGMCAEMLAVLSIRKRIIAARELSVKVREIRVRDGQGSHIDRCTTCHAGMGAPNLAVDDKAVFRAHSDSLLTASHPQEKFGCTLCHEGRGEELDPRHQSILKGKMVQSSCAGCHDNVVQLRGAPDALEGARLFQSLGCSACHEVKESPYLIGEAPPFGPDLNRIKHKVSAEWLVSWVSNPRKLKRRTMMPLFGDHEKGLPQDESIKIAAYLMSNSEEAVVSPAAASYASRSGKKNDSIVEGRKLVQEKGCLGCHDLGKSRAPGPRHIPLDDIGSKVSPSWLYSWIESPQSFSPQSTMPRFSLRQTEMAEISDYLSSLRVAASDGGRVAPADLESKDNVTAGRLLISKYGCYSCHRIPGFERQNKSGPSLDNFALRPGSSLSWGKLRRTVRPAERTWYAWTEQKLKDPSAIDSKHLKARMPHYRLAASEIEKLLIFLKTLSERRSAPELRRAANARESMQVAGWQLMNAYNCLGCHSRYDTVYGDTEIAEDGRHMPGRSRFEARARASLLPRMDQHQLDQALPVRWGNIAPNITFEGERVNYSWLRDYLKEPYKLRPYLEAVMPQFNFRPGDREKIMSCLGSKVKSPKPGAAVSGIVDPVSLYDGEEEMNEHLCFSCHQLNGKERAAAVGLKWYANMEHARRLAPDLSQIERLEPAWLEKWLSNPPAILPDTTMPYTAMTAEEIAIVREYLRKQAKAPHFQATSGSPTEASKSSSNEGVRK